VHSAELDDVFVARRPREGPGSVCPADFSPYFGKCTPLENPFERERRQIETQGANMSAREPLHIGKSVPPKGSLDRCLRSAAPIGHHRKSQAKSTSGEPYKRVQNIVGFAWIVKHRAPVELEERQRQSGGDQRPPDKTDRDNST
jgi:hypothetical protein